MHPTLTLPLKHDNFFEEFTRKLNDTFRNEAYTERRPVSYLNYDIHEGRLRVAVHASVQCEIEVRIYQVKIFRKHYNKVICHKTLDAGKHTLDFDEDVLTGFGTNFLSISVDRHPWTLRRL